MAQTHYCGTKESERPAVVELIETQGLAHQKLSRDALHLIPSTLAFIDGATGHYLVGLPKLYQACTLTDLFYPTDYQWVDTLKEKHGRVEQRYYRCFNLKAFLIAARWQKAGLCTLLCVVGNREKSDVVSEELRYYVSNQVVSSQAQADELFDAIRGHWGVEVMHHKRDVTLSEDALRSGKVGINRLLTSFRTLWGRSSGYQLIRRDGCQGYGCSIEPLRG